jgi:hypothetical protein
MAATRNLLTSLFDSAISKSKSELITASSVVSSFKTAWVV